jgi:hypothetical protein
METKDLRKFGGLSIVVGAEGFEPNSPTLMFITFFLAYAFAANRITDHFW